MLKDGKTTFNIAYDRCYCHVAYIHSVVGICYLPMDMMAKIAFVTDVIVTHVSVADGDHIFRDNQSVCIVADGKSYVSGWCYCHSGRCYYHIIVGWYFDHVADGTPHVWQLIIR